MNLEIKRVGDEWSAFDTSTPGNPLVTGKSFEECLQNLQQWEKDSGLTPVDYTKRVWCPK